MVMMPPQPHPDLAPSSGAEPATGPLVITVARQFGSGGDELAARIADAFGIPLLDREILTQAARQAGVSEETIARCEHRQGFIERMLERLSGAYSGDLLDAGLITTRALNFVTNEDYRRLIERVIAHIADEQQAVILGHAGQVVLRDRPNVFKVLVHADLEDRLSRVMRTEEVDAAAALRLINERDRDWSEMFRTAYRVDWMDARLYDLVINRSRIAEDVALRMVLEAVAGRPIADCGCL